ncbi:MAG: metallophosphoesterase [Bacteroidia bacterium]|nr:metallophosphoesterase [Bacteroidia bacterium]
MRIYPIFLLLFALIGLHIQAQKVVHTLFLIGDAGKDIKPGPTLQMLETELNLVENGTVVFMGDNIYPMGMVDELAKLRMLSQLRCVKNFKGNVVVVPGNHDWKEGLWDGQQVLKAEQEFVEKYLKDSSLNANKDQHTFLPLNGFPGPESMLIGPKLRMVFIDTQWWLQSQFFHSTPKFPGMNRKQTSQAFFQRLDSLLKASKANGEQIIVSAHHPLFSMGHHGRPKQPLRFLVNWTPFQIFGLLGLNRMLVQDIPQPRYKRLKKKFLALFDSYENLIYTSGHDHNLQYFKHGPNHYLVSGAGSKLNKIEHHSTEAKFLNGMENGFMKLEFLDNGHVVLKVWGVKSGWNLYQTTLF